MPASPPPRPQRAPAQPPPPEQTDEVAVARMSPSLSHFAPAFVQVQLKLRPVIKKSENPHFKSTFANLGDILAEALPVLGDHGFGLMQFPATDERGGLALMSMLIHESGQYVSATMPLMVVKQDPQGEGSAISYGRRYAACAILGIRTADDDGNEASGRPDRQNRMEQPPRGEDAQPPNAEGWADLAAEKAAHWAATEQIKQLFAIIPEDHSARAEIKAYRDQHGWPMGANDLMQLSMMVAKAHGIAVAAQEASEPASESERQPEPAAPAPAAPSAPPAAPDGEQPWDNLPKPPTRPAKKAAEDKPLCAWCEKPVIGPKVLTGGTNPDDPVKQWHKTCYEEQQKEDESS